MPTSILFSKYYAATKWSTVSFSGVVLVSQMKTQQACMNHEACLLQPSIRHKHRTSALPKRAMLFPLVCIGLLILFAPSAKADPAFSPPAMSPPIGSAAWVMQRPPLLASTPTAPSFTFSSRIHSMFEAADMRPALRRFYSARSSPKVCSHRHPLPAEGCEGRSPAQCYQHFHSIHASCTERVY